MLIVRPEAEEDLGAAYEWYEDQRAGLGLAFLGEADSALSRIEDRPHGHPKVLGAVRRAFLRRFPYSVYYLVADQRLVVLAVLHHRRSPAEWRRRLGE